MKKNKLQTLIAYTVFLFILGSYCAWEAGSYFIKSNNSSVEQPKVDVDYASISIESGSGAVLKGWLFNVDQSKPVIAIFHGLRSNKGFMLGRAEFLVESGFNVLLIDLRGHGESVADEITFGAKESLDVDASIRYIRKAYPNSKVGVIGVSMGGAASLLGEQPADIDALVLEGVYSSIHQAVLNRMRILAGPAAPLVTSILQIQIAPRLGVSTSELNPIDKIGQFKNPIYIIGGELDRKTLSSETLALYEASNEPKSLWLVKEAKHQNLHEFAGETYETNIVQFFNTHLLATEL